MGLRRNGRSVRSCLLLTRRRRRSLGRFFRFRGGRGRWAERWAVDEWIPWSLHPHFVTSDLTLYISLSIYEPNHGHGSELDTNFLYFSVPTVPQYHPLYRVLD